jgi:hypothetical protein
MPPEVYGINFALLSWAVPIVEQIHNIVKNAGHFIGIFLFSRCRCFMMSNNHYRAIMEEVCIGCKIHRNTWKGNNGRGYSKDGETYCCRDCAEGIECMCSL